jgi:serine/threonine-protein kinase HipA
MTKRFDRDGTERLHVHTLGGMQHVDYNERGAFSYEEWFRTIRLLGLDQPTLDQAFRRMVFNLAGVNQDDHVKNFAFLMQRYGRWQLAPAYDLTFAAGNVWTRTHQMTLSGKDDDFTRADVLAAGAAFDVAHDGARIVDEVDAAIGMWEGEAADVGVAPDMIDRIGKRFRRFAN